MSAVQIGRHLVDPANNARSEPGWWVLMVLVWGITLTLAYLDTVTASADGGAEDVIASADGRLALPPKLHSTLVAEMAGLKKGVGELAAALSIGAWPEATAIATAMHDSYIMRQALTDGELHQLTRLLPVDFVERDASLHQHAAALAVAAGKRDVELTVFYFGKVLEACQSCHTRYASHVLTGFASPTGAAAPPHEH